LCAKAALFIRQGPLKQHHDLFFGKRSQHIHAAAREQAAMISNDGFSVVAPISRMFPFSHVRQECVLLRFV